MTNFAYRLQGAWLRLMPLRFVVVGVWNFVFGYLAFAVCYWLMNGNFKDWLIVLLSSVLGITNSFVFHRWLTFRSHGNWMLEYFKFYLVYGVQVVVTVVVVDVFVTKMKWNAYVVSFTNNMMLTLVSYWVHKYFSFGCVKVRLKL